MRDVHGELLKRRREAGLSASSMLGPRPTDRAAEELIRDASEFLRRGLVTGCLLDLEDERAAAQSLLTYWANILQRLGLNIDDATLADFDPSLAPELPDSACPYLGLDAFRESDSGRFFGRETMVADLAARLSSERLLLVAGPSGSGKSSLVRAGLAPALRRGAATGSEGWRFIEPLMPGSEPFMALARALRPGASRQQIIPTARELRERPTRLPTFLGSANGAPCLLIVDQFEELFTLTENEAERLAFVSALLAAADAPEPGHRVLLTMRSDFEPFAAAMPELGERLERIRVTMLPLGPVELRRAIEAPAQAIGLKFEPGVVDLLVQDIVGEPAGLPLLQFTLLKLWEQRERNRITLAAYDRVGGGRLALARSADSFYEQLIPEDQVTLKRVLLRMVRPGEGLEVTSSRIRMDSIYALGEDPGRVERVVQKLLDERLLRLTPGDADSSSQIEVAHEALVRNWPRLVGWLEDEKLALATRRRLEQRAEEWVRLGSGKAGLLDEAQLHEAERWVASPEAAYLGYNPQLARLIFASREALDEAEAEREALRQRELAQARALAAEQQARAEAQSAQAQSERRSRNVARVLSGLMAILALAAFYLFFQAQQSATAARQQEQLAVQQGATAQAGAATNVSLANTADALRSTAESQSQIEQQLRTTAEIAGTAEAEKAAEAAANAREARAGQLAAQAQASLAERPQRSLLLALAGVNATNPPVEVARSALLDAVARTNGEGLGNHAGRINAAAVSADGRLVATAGEDGARLWDPAVAGRVGAGPALNDLGEPARLTALSADGRWLAVAGASRVWVYPISAGQAGQGVEVYNNAEVTEIGISPAGGGGSWLVIGDADGRVRGVQLGASAPGSLATLSRPADADGAITALAFTPDGNYALSGGADRVTRVWDLRPARSANRFAFITLPRSGSISAIAVSRDGRWVAIGSADYSIHIWSFGANGFTGSPAVKTGHQGSITALTFSPDGRWLLSGSSDRNARLWSSEDFATTSAEAIVLTGHSRSIGSAAFSPDSRLAVTGSDDSDLLIWQLDNTRAAALRLHGHDAGVTAVLVSGERLLSAGADGQLRRWPFPPQSPDTREAAIANSSLEQVKALACTIAGRDLSPVELELYFADSAPPAGCAP